MTREMKRNYQNIAPSAKKLRDELNRNSLTRSEVYDNITAIIKKRFAALFDA